MRPADALTLKLSRALTEHGILDHPGGVLEQVVPAANWGEGRSRDRLFGEEQRQDTISERGGNFHAGEVTARVGFNGPNKARLKCGPSNLPNRQVSQVTTMWTSAGVALHRRPPAGKPPTTAARGVTGFQHGTRGLLQHLAARSRPLACLGSTRSED